MLHCVHQLVSNCVYLLFGAEQVVYGVLPLLQIDLFVAVFLQNKSSVCLLSGASLQLWLPVEDMGGISSDSTRGYTDRE